MSVRKEIFVTGEMYHVFNRSIDRQKIYKGVLDYQRMMRIIDYYRFADIAMKYSRFTKLEKDQRDDLLKKMIETSPQLIEINAFCIMPNHFHFLIRPLKDNGLSKFMSYIQHSYSKYFNTKYNRTGVLFQGSFKVVRIESEEQFIHTHRYIHLNPVTSYLVAFENIASYRWSSYLQMQYSENSFVVNSAIWEYFSSFESYKSFLEDQVDYQRELHNVAQFR